MNIRQKKGITLIALIFIVVLVLLVAILGIRIIVNSSGLEEGGGAQERTFEEIMREERQLEQDNWSEYFFARMVFTLNSDTIIIDRLPREYKEIDLDSVPQFVNGELMLPVRPILDTIGEENLEGDLFSIADIMLPANLLEEKLMVEIRWNEETERIVLTRDFQTRRLSVKPYLPMDFSIFNPTDIVEGWRGIVYVQFATIHEAREAYRQLSNDENVEWVEPDRIQIASSQTSQDMQEDDFGWEIVKTGNRVYAEYLHSGEASREIVVAIIDSGINESHPFMEGRVIDGWNFVSDHSNTNVNYFSHGTSVAGVVVKNTPLLDVRIMPVQVLRNHGAGGYKRDVIRGIDWAVENGA
ncbi:MAG: S8 family serine peptidase, partial [Oscillospiraceae bacterium]|nr:S8 family serine peptidase [Oscillospiraceae bacterium]